MTENNFIHQGQNELTVTEVSTKVKELLEGNIGNIRVKGEISGLKIASSGHCYFNLKENLNILCCTCWRHVIAKLKFVIEEGMDVVVQGRLTAYGGTSRYQLSVDVVSPGGVGAMVKILQDRKKKLQDEGIFDKIKKNLPLFPKRIGVVTSITGAVIKDIIHRISDRCPLHIIIWSVSVQGEKAASEISEAIDGFNNCSKEHIPDVIIVARGGGSIEDLMAFNEEIVVRSVFNSKIPIVSAVGHEGDYSLIDLVSDRRAPTPTAAAEFVTPVNSILKSTLASHYSLVHARINHIMKYYQQNLDHYTGIYKNLENNINYRQQMLDDLSFRLEESLPKLLRIKTLLFRSMDIARVHPLKIIESKKIELNHQVNYIIKATYSLFAKFEYQVHLKDAILKILDYKNVLKRGFAIIQTQSLEYVCSKNVAMLNDKLTIKFFDGDIAVKHSDQES